MGNIIWRLKIVWCFNLFQLLVQLNIKNNHLYEVEN